MRIALISFYCVTLFIEATLWIFLRPAVGKTLIAFLGLSAGAGIGVGCRINPALPAAIGFFAVFLVVPGGVFARAKDKRVDWWRRKFAEFQEPLRRYANLILDAPGPW
ncbi:MULTISPECIES: hypothetical protein [unclassified Rhizobium]|uniref:hypothetical protein n=1 Tax=unclassified Rhizobium TaxID=2613769 RepID=UPI0012E3C30E|nr:MULTISPECIES: hypothetical protein [unclassified Rhizobium]